MKRRYIKLILAFFVLAICMVFSVSALENNAGLRVTAKYGESPQSGIGIALYKVGNAREEKGVVVFDTAAVIANANPDEIIDFNGMSDGENREISSETALRIRNIMNGRRESQPYISLADIKIQPVVTDKNGTAQFDGLEPGVYLVMQEGTSGFETAIPFLVPLPYTDNEGVQIYHAEAFIKLQAYASDDDEPEYTTAATENETESTTAATESTETTENTETEPTETMNVTEEKEAPKVELPPLGALRWPVPFLAMCGVLLFGLGYISEKKN
ncbi:MAG: hypothetical protein E7432_08710 [Ruminococcaceae bacterium]|nr:hypothetical protein [Oscillospiraceae bacterium]